MAYNNVMNRYFCIIVLSIISISNVQAQDSQKLSNAIRVYLKVAAEEPTPKYQYATTDLNGDSKTEAIVLIRDRGYCVLAGCTLLIFTESNSAFKFISSSIASNPPIHILNTLSHGWKSIIVRSGGIGNVVLTFNGKGYPNNSSLQSKATQQQLTSSSVLIESYSK